MENDLEIIVKLHAESTRIARDSIEAVHAYEKWVHALPIELKKQLRAHPHPEIVWETKKSQVARVFIDPGMPTAPSVRVPKPEQVEKQTQKEILT